MNPLASAALVLIGIAQITLAYSALIPSPEEVHFRVLQEFCRY
jgi:hypothetical protein